MAWPDALPRRGLYLITPDTTDSLRLFSQCLRVLPARPALLQYRNKSTDPALRLAQAQTLRALTRAAGVGLIINDDVALAAQVGADGVHLGRDDGDIAAARARLGEHAILGASCYDQLPLARAATVTTQATPRPARAANAATDANATQYSSRSRRCGFGTAAAWGRAITRRAARLRWVTPPLHLHPQPP